MCREHELVGSEQCGGHLLHPHQWPGAGHGLSCQRVPLQVIQALQATQGTLYGLKFILQRSKYFHHINLNLKKICKNNWSKQWLTFTSQFKPLQAIFGSFTLHLPLIL